MCIPRNSFVLCAILLCSSLCTFFLYPVLFLAASFTSSLRPSILLRPEGTLATRDPPSPSLCQTQGRETGTTADSASLPTHTHSHTGTLKSSPFAKFSLIRVPPWFVPHHNPSSFLLLFALSLFLSFLLNVSSVDLSFALKSYFSC